MRCGVHGVTDDVHAYVRRTGDRNHKAGSVRHECRQCHREKRYPSLHRPVNALTALWQDNAAEYWFLREQGLTPQEIGAKHDVRWESFQRTLWRRIGGKDKW